MIHQLLHGCPVCRQRTRHLVFCRYRPAPLDPWTVRGLVLGAVACFWLATFIVAGWRGVATMAAVGFFAEIVLFALSTREKARTEGPYRPEEIVGELYPKPKPKRRAPNKPEAKGPPLRSRRRTAA